MTVRLWTQANDLYHFPCLLNTDIMTWPRIAVPTSGAGRWLHREAVTAKNLRKVLCFITK